MNVPSQLQYHIPRHPILAIKALSDLSGWEFEIVQEEAEGADKAAKAEVWGGGGRQPGHRLESGFLQQNYKDVNLYGFWCRRLQT